MPGVASIEPTVRRTLMSGTPFRTIAAATGIALGVAFLSAQPAAAANATATLTGAGSPAILSSTTPSWSQTLDGLDHIGLSTTANVDVNDATGTGSGWNFTLSYALLPSGSHSLGHPPTHAAATFPSSV